MNRIKSVAIIGFFIGLLLLTGCTKKVNQDQVTDTVEIKVAALKGPTAMGLVKMINDNEKEQNGNRYSLTIAGAADAITAGIIKGEYDIAMIPCNLASVLYKKSEGKIQVAGINTLGVLYIVETGESIQNVSVLKGRTIYSTGKGTTP